MTDILHLCPEPRGWRVPWQEINARFPWIRNLRGCFQNPRYHAEGDVWVHTRMVCEAMAELESWRGLTPELRQDLFAAALLHDAAKPECTKIQADGRVTSRGHARRGSILARGLLWQARIPRERRERISNLVRHHMVPLYLRDSDFQERQVLNISQSLRCDHLSILGLADARGRICDDPEDLRLRHRAFDRICRDLGCLEQPFEFAGSVARFEYFHPPVGVSTSDDRFEVVLMSGLPGAGKSAWVQEYLPDLERIDVDALRRDHEVTWWDNQGAVISAARDRARELLEERRPFVYVDLNLSRQLRDHLVRLFVEQGARVRIVHVEADPDEVDQRLRGSATRKADLQVLLDHWEVPEPTEAHRVVYLDADLKESLVPEAAVPAEPEATPASVEHATA